MKLSGMWRDALNGLLRRPVTQNYPFERLEAPERLRSKLHWNLSSCTGCGLCAKDCPADAIEVITLDRKAKRFVFRYHVDRCTFCGQCVVSGRQGCLNMSTGEWELAELDRQTFEVLYGNDADVAVVLAHDDDADDAESDAAPASAA